MYIGFPRTPHCGSLIHWVHPLYEILSGFKSKMPMHFRFSFRVFWTSNFVLKVPDFLRDLISDASESPFLTAALSKSNTSASLFLYYEQCCHRAVLPTMTMLWVMDLLPCWINVLLVQCHFPTIIRKQIRYMNKKLHLNSGNFTSIYYVRSIKI